LVEADSAAGSPARESDDVPAEEGTPRRRWWQRLLSGPTFIVAAVVTALAGVAAPVIWNVAQDGFRPPVLVWAGPYGSAVGDNSKALPEVVEAARATEIGSDAESDMMRRSVAVGVHGATVTIEGARSRDVVITNMRARILSRGPNFAGTLFSDPPQGGVAAEQIGFDLDESQPVARKLDGGKFGEPYFAGQAIQLADGEIVVFKVQTHAADGHYRWVIDIDMVVDGEPQTHTVQPAEGAFEVTGRSPRYGSEFHRNDGRWVAGR
jgi:hypothetical protein